MPASSKKISARSAEVLDKYSMLQEEDGMCRERKNLVLLCVFVLGLSTLFAEESAGAGRHKSDEQALAPLVPGDSQKGLAVFLDKRCTVCHSLPGEPAKEGPVIQSRHVVRDGHAQPFTAGDIAAEFWNHAPVMWRKMKETGFEYFPFTEGQMSDLFAFLYYAGLLDPVGDAE